jgi:uncharacterized Ntn-hydrolase superfamily protein
MTYSIVARDPETGQMGVGVQTCMFAVGSIVPWARAGVGAVATQAVGEPAYGPRCLDALAAGANAREALAAAREVDPLATFRQVGVLAADGSVTSSTGDHCIPFAESIVGDDYAAQGNMLSNPDVVPAIAAAFEGSSGPLAHRLLAALRAGEDAGGDARGSMSAALLVVEGTPPEQPAGGGVVDIRIDRSDDPIGAMSRLLDASDAFAGFGRAVDQLMGGDPTASLTSIDEALELLPAEGNMRLIRAAALLSSGATDEGIAEFRSLVAERPTWEVIGRGFVDVGLMSLPEGVSPDDVFG